MYIYIYMIPNAHKLPRILSALLVTVFTTFLIIFVLNIYLFVKNTLSSEVYFTHLFFNPFLNDLKFLKY